MSLLREIFIELLREEEIGSESYRTQKLKARLIKDFENKLAFWHPRYRVKSEIVYSNLIPKGAIIEEKQMQSEDQWDDEILASCEMTDSSKQSNGYLSNVYYSAAFIRQEINNMKLNLPQPPSSEDISKENIIILDLLYNLLAWIVSGDDSKSLFPKNVLKFQIQCTNRFYQSQRTLCM